MTTTVKVQANHGWPVDVTTIPRDGSTGGPKQRVAANTEGMFAVHSGQDLLVREVQPGDDLKALTEGEYRVGKAFNPSSSATVDTIKARAADLIDMLAPIAADRDHPGARCASVAMTEIESAAMWAVKAVTKQPR